MHGSSPDATPSTVARPITRPILVNESTTRAIRLGRVLCTIPHLATLIVMITWQIMPPQGASSAFVQPIRFTNLLGGGVFYWWGIFVGALCIFISLLIQAYGKLPEYAKEGYLDVDDVPITSGHTDSILSRDAILEIVVFMLSILFSTLGTTFLDPVASTGYKVTVTGLAAMMMAICVYLIIIGVRTLINSWREGLSHRDFQRWTLQTAREAVWICVFITLFMVYASMVVQAQELPLYYVSYTGSIFPPEGIGCPNQNATTELINSFPCPVQPLCGMRTWQIACMRIQMAESSRAVYLFSVTFPFHVILMWFIIKMYSIGNVKRDDQEGNGSGATDAKPLLQQKARAKRKQGATKIAQVAPAEVAQYTSDGEQSPQSPPPIVKSPSLRNSRVTNFRSRATLTRTLSSLENPHNARSLSYSHMFQPQMFVAALFLVYVNLIICYQFSRFIFLGSFVSQQVPQFPSPLPLEPPGVCYGSCTLHITLLSWAGGWVVAFILLTYDKLKELFSRLKMKTTDTNEQMEERARVEAEIAEQRANDEVTFNFVTREYILGYRGNELPVFQKLRGLPNALVKRTIHITRALCGEYATLEEYCIVSHRWFSPAKPDDDSGTQLFAIQEHLRSHPNIRYVWFDYWCMPQGRKQTLAEKAAFSFMLKNINYLYLGMHVLILLDVSYPSRFWTQYEAWLSMQSVTPDGLRASTADERQGRCTIRPISNANDALVESVRETWATKSPREAHKVLSGPDIQVTNLSDKTIHLGKIMELDNEVHQAFQKTEVSAFEPSSP